MNKIIQFITDTVSASFGNPVRLQRLLAERPEFKAILIGPADNIAMDSVPRWQNITTAGIGVARRRAKRSELLGWRREGTRYGSFNASCPALGCLVTQVVVNNWKCDLQDLYGFAASKSKLETFGSMEEMVEANSSDMIEDVSAEGLRKNLAHDQIRVTGANPGTDWLQVHQWDGRMYLVNDGGSHHLAAAKYIAARTGASVAIAAPLHYYKVDVDAVAALRSEYDIFLVNNESELSNTFFSAIEAAGATWLWHEMPHPYHGVRAIFLPRAEPLSMRVSRFFQEAGYIDLGAHLEVVADRDTPHVISKYLPGHDLDGEEEQVSRYG
jgi:hypothetical protein